MLWSASCWSFQHGQQCQLCPVFPSVPVVWSRCWIRNVNRGTPAHGLDLYISPSRDLQQNPYISSLLTVNWIVARRQTTSCLGFIALCSFSFLNTVVLSQRRRDSKSRRRSDEGLSMMNQGGEGAVPLGVGPSWLTSWLPVCLQFSCKTSEGENPV